MSQKGQENPNPMLTYLESKDPLENWKLIELTYHIIGCLSNANYMIDILIFHLNYFVLFIETRDYPAVWSTQTTHEGNRNKW